MARVRRLLAGVLSLFSFSTGLARADQDASSLAVRVDRASVLAGAVRSHPAIRSAEHRARALEQSGKSEGSLPPPEAMLQVWQIPIAKPYAIGDAQMVMIGVGQAIPAPGSRGARRRAAEHEAEAERASGSEAERRIRQQVEHAFVDYVEATERHLVHREHLRVGWRTVELARARHAGGGSLSEVAQAEVEVARTDADVVTDATRIEAARGRLNALLGRDVLAPLGPPVSGDAEVTAWDMKKLLTTARELRPELRARIAKREARREEEVAAEKEALIPSFNVAALYFAPTSPMPQHGYGANAAMTLPWLWGEASSRRDARRDATAAARSDLEAEWRPIAADVAAQEAGVRAAAARLQTLRDRALLASRRAFDVALAGYESGRTDVLTLLSTRRSVVDVETEIVAARSALDHALADLDAAVGTPVPRRPLGLLDPALLEGGQHAR